MSRAHPAQALYAPRSGARRLMFDRFFYGFLLPAMCCLFAGVFGGIILGGGLMVLAHAVGIVSERQWQATGSAVPWFVGGAAFGLGVGVGLWIWDAHERRERREREEREEWGGQ